VIDKNTRKTSEHWSRESSYVQILKHDGWNTDSLSSFQYAWFVEPITEREFFKRLSDSTIKMKVK